MSQNVNNLELDDKTKKRFLKKIKKQDEADCWDWTSCTTSGGYGTFRIKNKNYGAHRVSYLIHFGNYDHQKCVLHKCDNPACVNPEHLWLGTQTDNMKDMDTKKRRKFGTSTGERHGMSKLFESDVINIKKMLSDGLYQKEIAKEYNISQVAVSLIKREINWKHILGENNYE